MDLDLNLILGPDLPVLELMLRGTIMYLSIFVVLRIIIKQAAGALNLADLLLIVLIADAAQNAMTGEYNSIADGLVLVLTLVFWSYAIDWLGYHWSTFGGWIHPKPARLVKDGIMLRKNMRNELVSYEELMTYVRQAGANELRQVQDAWMEGNGEVSVILKDSDSQKSENRAAMPG
jgi:uncharacterized membrane protein YcaP (DUF421 family)